MANQERGLDVKRLPPDQIFNIEHAIAPLFIIDKPPAIRYPKTPDTIISYGLLAQGEPVGRVNIVGLLNPDMRLIDMSWIPNKEGIRYLKPKVTTLKELLLELPDWMKIAFVDNLYILPSHRGRNLSVFLLNQSMQMTDFSAVDIHHVYGTTGNPNVLDKVGQLEGHILGNGKIFTLYRNPEELVIDRPPFHYSGKRSIKRTIFPESRPYSIYNMKIVQEDSGRWLYIIFPEVEQLSADYIDVLAGDRRFDKRNSLIPSLQHANAIINPDLKDYELLEVISDVLGDIGTCRWITIYQPPPVSDIIRIDSRTEEENIIKRNRPLGDDYDLAKLLVSGFFQESEKPEWQFAIPVGNFL